MGRFRLGMTVGAAFRYKGKWCVDREIGEVAWHPGRFAILYHCISGLGDIPINGIPIFGEQ
jgi:hypothetical protein